ncbi:HesA/MoeB/ThiF family protein [Trichloromonas sp.]|uniref:HesA/MoeB/ThiF family protein n=1 Tax=Trichloromonas sp. TaxID=3069249 RepID=UPI003D8127F1
MTELLEFIRSRCTGDLFPWTAQVAAAERFGLSLAQVEAQALAADILPARYQRNRQIISCDDQRTLFGSRVAVIGCGGLGGYIIEELARLGVGELLVVDPDVFEEHNLNRQLLATPLDLGRRKVDVAAERVARVNPAVSVTAVPEAFGAAKGGLLLKGARVAVDGLDSINVRLELAAVCRDLGIPLVHGAIAGWYGQLTTQQPGDLLLEKIYRGQGHAIASKGVEKELGNPSFTPAVVASLEVAEVCKLLLDRGTPLTGRCLNVDLLDMEFCEISL